MIRRGVFFFGILLILSFFMSLSASETTYRDLSLVLPDAKNIIKGRVESFEKKEVGDAQRQKTEYLYVVEAEKVLLGEQLSGRFKVRYTYTEPVLRKEGKIIMRVSPVLNASGIETSLEEGVSYLFFFPRSRLSNDSYNEVMRVDPLDKEAEVLKSIAR